MKRALTSLLALALLCVAGCQKTPEASIVTGKSSDALIEKAQADPGTGSLADRLGAPETYESRVSSQDGKLTVTIDAAVTVPDADAVPILRVTPGVITQEQADALIESLVHTTLYAPSQHRTREEIEEDLLDAKRAQAEGPPAGSEDTVFLRDSQQITWEEYMQDEIDWLQEEYEEAPAEPEKTPISGKFQPEEAYDRTISVIRGQGESEEYGFETVSIVQDVPGAVGDTGASYSRAKEHIPSYCPQELMALYYPDLDLDTVPEPSITADEARAQADAVVEKLDIPNMTCYSVRKKYDAVGTAFGDEPAVCRWEVRYTRAIGGVPVTYVSNSDSYASGGPFQDQWDTEQLALYVGDSGVTDLVWDSPYALGDAVTDDSALMSFGDIMDIFEKMYVVRSDGMNEDVNVVAIRLGYARLRQQDDPGSGLLVPVWDFFGSICQHVDGAADSLVYDPEQSLLTINAVDGSIVDRALGY